VNKSSARERLHRFGAGADRELFVTVAEVGADGVFLQVGGERLLRLYQPINCALPENVFVIVNLWPSSAGGS
jgi:hypothetical protein